ncbi:MAG: L,D-transpeptidase family protein [Candidatus Latescibacteria bacterium]|nr:L,D-transpeptidase family protein [Candidatus Latescibacterota bacterium]MBT4139210.1 L,D-transpeptidase family protein [Candidatus Latescibacterota bacterium]MBT5832455.1 L,D-transpeptidase family protein [Candidatus Latescibacterota bacterium]
MLLQTGVVWGNEIIGVDKVVVYKAKRELQLCEEDSVLRRYKIALGKNVTGHKQHAGDSRTPEGKYVLDWRNPNSKYYLSFHISYPNLEDEKRAQALGVSSGGDIFIHGYPTGISAGLWSRYWFLGKDWTDGCIAVSNEAMDEIWASVRDGTPIEIYP